MRSSIRKQFAFIFIGLMAGVILLCWIANSFFLEKYYSYRKQKVIYSAYEEIKEAANSDSYNSDDFLTEVNQICNRDNITICVLDSDSNTKYASVNGGERLELRLLGYIFDQYHPSDIQVLDAGDEYKMQRVYADGSEVLEMYGRLNSGISFIMRTPMESIRESAALANRFFFYVGALATLAGGILILFVARKVTEPILDLNEISKRMVELDFEAKYQKKAHNEIDLLGENINILSASLEKSIAELKTANNELQKDIEKKEQIDEMRKEFLNSVSHELKTPIALIQGYAEGLLEGIKDDEESRNFYCEVIMDEASKMNSMVKKLLTLNELEFGNEVVNMERFDLAALIKGCVQASEILLKQQEIQVKLLMEESVYVWADEFKIEEVFNNYLSNAVNHCEGEKVIEIKAMQQGSIVRVCVTNTGKEIPQDSMPYIWDKFYKVDKARTREYGGSGIGLSIVKAIMESMHQEYGVYNENGKVTFWFQLEVA